MSNILCIETATTNCSVAIGVDGKLLGLKEDNSKQFSHAEKLHLSIVDLIEENNLKLQDLDAIAISKGPGSYTGLRIGVSAAKGLCFSLDIPLISVPTLTSLALQVKGKGTVFSMLDARRMEVYSAGFDLEMKQIRETKAQILEETSFSEYLQQGPVYFIGTGVEKFQDICSHYNARFVEGRLPSAKEMIGIADQKFKDGDLENVAYFEPYYLKDFMAG